MRVVKTRAQLEFEYELRRAAERWGIDLQDEPEEPVDLDPLEQRSRNAFPAVAAEFERRSPMSLPEIVRWSMRLWDEKQGAQAELFSVDDEHRQLIEFERRHPEFSRKAQGRRDRLGL